MSQIVLSPNASGTGQFTIASPNSNTNQTFNLPDATGTVLIDGTSSQTLQGNLNVPSLNTGQLAGMRNKIINGKMDIAQRGTSFAAIASGAYSLDRYVFANNASAVLTVSQQSDVPSNNEFQNSLRLAVTTADASLAAGDVTTIAQYIEGFNVRDLIGRTFTLSFWARSSKTGIHCVSFRNSISDRSYVVEYTVNAANTWEFKTITVSGGLITAGTWNWTNGIGLRVDFALAAGSTFQTTAGAWQTGNFLATANQVNVLDSNTNIFAITGVQLEVGAVATPFEHRLYGEELMLCQRYYEKSFSQTTVPAQSLGVNTGEFQFLATRTGAVTNWSNKLSFAVTKRANPSLITLFNPVAANAQIRDFVALADFSASVINQQNDSGFSVTGVGNAGTSAGNICGVHWTATAEL